MSDLGRLFNLCQWGPKPLENFTTTALAIAIDHDNRPFKEAVCHINCDDGRRDPTLEKLIAADMDKMSVSAQTQVTLYATDELDGGFLDLVLTFDGGFGPVWVEVKVDSGVNGNQIGVYRAHAQGRDPRPAIITLGRDVVEPTVPFLKWSQIANAITKVPDPHEAWLNLYEFLSEQEIVYRPVTLEPLDVNACIKVIVAVNKTIRALWPDAGTTLAWVDGTLESKLRSWFASEGTMSTTGGPLHYGLTRGSQCCEWFIAVRTKNYERVPLRPEEILRDADAGGLSAEWTRQPGNGAVLERRVSALAVGSGDEIVDWFDKGLRQLRDTKILDGYLNGLRARLTDNAAPPRSESALNADDTIEQG